MPWILARRTMGCQMCTEPVLQVYTINNDTHVAATVYAALCAYHASMTHAGGHTWIIRHHATYWHCTCFHQIVPVTAGEHDACRKKPHYGHLSGCLYDAYAWPCMQQP